MNHIIQMYRSPVNVTVRCSCGWTRSVTRHQNAFARAAKIRKLMREHSESVQRYEPPFEPDARIEWEDS